MGQDGPSVLLYMMHCNDNNKNFYIIHIVHVTTSSPPITRERRSLQSHVPRVICKRSREEGESIEAVFPYRVMSRDFLKHGEQSLDQQV